MDYEYDSHPLSIKVFGLLPLKDDQKIQKLIGSVMIGRNESPSISCGYCKATDKTMAAYICSGCGDVFACKKHRSRHDCDAPFLPLINSPRTGMCGYTGPDKEYAL